MIQTHHAFCVHLVFFLINSELKELYIVYLGCVGTGYSPLQMCCRKACWNCVIPSSYSFIHVRLFILAPHHTFLIWYRSPFHPGASDSPLLLSVPSFRLITMGGRVLVARPLNFGIPYPLTSETSLESVPWRIETFLKANRREGVPYEVAIECVICQ